MTSRLKLPFKLTDSKKSNEFEVNETSKKDDFSLSEVSHLFFFFSFDHVKTKCTFENRSFDTDFLIDRQHSRMIPYKKYSPLERKMELLKCK